MCQFWPTDCTFDHPGTTLLIMKQHCLRRQGKKTNTDGLLDVHCGGKTMKSLIKKKNYINSTVKDLK